MTTKRVAYVVGLIAFMVGMVFFLRLGYSELWPWLLIAFGGGMLGYGASGFK